MPKKTIKTRSLNYICQKTKTNKSCKIFDQMRINKGFYRKKIIIINKEFNIKIFYTYSTRHFGVLPS